MKVNLKPCKTCPWRKGNGINPILIPGFSAELVERLRGCVPPRGESKDGIYKIMACHGSDENNPTPCIGYAAVEGEKNILLRAYARENEFSILEIQKSCADVELYPSFYSMYDDFYSSK